MSDDNNADVPPAAEESGGFEPSRRGFIYGTAAVAAGAALSSRIAGSSRRPRLRAGTPARPVGSAVAGGVPPPVRGVGWALLQAGPARHGTGSVAVTMNVGSAGGTLLVVTLLSTDPAGTFSPPATQTGWRLAKAVRSAPGGRAEIWYYPGIPPSPGSPAGITTATFTAASTADCRGAMAEFSMPAGTMPVLDAPGKANGTTGELSLTAASGNVAGDLGIALATDFFDGSVLAGSGWTGPSGWTDLQGLDSGAADPWAAWYNLGLGAGVQSLSASFAEISVSGAPVPVQTSWAFGFAAFRAARFQALHLDGSEVTTMVALDPTGQEIVMGGDVEGLWRTADFGDHWQLSQDGLYGTNWRCTASVDWSQLESGAVYACVGKHGNDGGFLASPDGGVTWKMRSTTVQFQGNEAAVRPTGEGTDTDRSVGRLLAQDPQAGPMGALYAATYSGGVYQSSDGGFTWTGVGNLGDGTYFLRAIVLNPANTKEAWVGAWNYGSTDNFGGVWHTPDVTSASTKFTQLEGFPTGSGAQIATVSDLLITGGYLYALSTTNGLFRRQIGVTGWIALNVAPITLNAGGPIWTGMDGYFDQATGNHVIVLVCGNGVQLGSNSNFTNVVKVTIDSAGNAIGSDLTGTAQIDIGSIPPDDHAFWRATSGYHNWLGGNNFHNAHVLIDPDNHSRIFVTGGGGFFRTENGDAEPASVVWEMAVNGAPMSAAHLIAVDPSDSTGTHVVIAGSDFPQTDLMDPTGWDTSKVHSPGGVISGNECHALAFDTNSNVFTGVNAKYGKNFGGGVFWRASDDSSFTWNDTKYSDHTANAPIGIYVATDAVGQPFAVVVAQGLGMVRGVPSEPTMTKTWNWATPSTTIGTKTVVGQHCPIVAGGVAGHLYCYDRGQGLFRSADYGKTWSSAPIWSLADNGLAVQDERSGWVAANPTAAGDELWVSTNDAGGLFKLTIDSSGAVKSTPMGGTSFPNGVGGIVFNPSGQPYVVALPGALPKADPQSSTLLLTLPAGSSTWTDAGGDSVGSYASWPTCLTMTAKGMILLASDEDFGVYGFPLA